MIFEICRLEAVAKQEGLRTQIDTAADAGKILTFNMTQPYFKFESPGTDT